MGYRKYPCMYCGERVTTNALGRASHERGAACRATGSNRKAAGDESLGIASAGRLGIVRRWSCGCAEVDDAGVLREQPDMFCDGFEERGHKRRVVQGGAQGELFPQRGEDDGKDHG